MEFLGLFLRGVAVIPSLVQGVEVLYGACAGKQKKDQAIAIVSSSINMAEAVESKKIVDADGFAGGLGMIVDGVVKCLNASVWHKAKIEDKL